MKTFRCGCGNRLFFESQHCGACGETTLFLPARRTMVTARPDDQGTWTPVDGSPERYRQCQNGAQGRGCNWAIQASETQALCASCRLTRTIPDLVNLESVRRWTVFEEAKRRLLYTLGGLGQVVVGKDQDAERGLAFDFLADPGSGGPHASTQAIKTGHLEGVITVNIAEADPVARVEAREAMGERYRTPLGHLRHEVGHYYWDRQIRDAGRTGLFRETFGDERADYDAALQRHYAAGPPLGWNEHHVSAYATSHPFEDWAETCAHYFHAVDAVETALDFGLLRSPGAGFSESLAAWMELSVALNAMNRSLGLEDAYPFVLTETVRRKLTFVDAIFTATPA